MHDTQLDSFPGVEAARSLGVWWCNISPDRRTAFAAKGDQTEREGRQTCGHR